MYRHKSISNTPSASNKREATERKKEREKKRNRKERAKDPKTFRASREAVRSDTRLSINNINVRRSSAFSSKTIQFTLAVSLGSMEGSQEGNRLAPFCRAISRQTESTLSLSLSRGFSGHVTRPFSTQCAITGSRADNETISAIREQ